MAVLRAPRLPWVSGFHTLLFSSQTLNGPRHPAPNHPPPPPPPPPQVKRSPRSSSGDIVSVGAGGPPAWYVHPSPKGAAAPRRTE